MQSVTVKSLKNLQQLVVTSGHALVADEPKDMGDDLGPSPYELLLAALGSCTAITLLLYVRRKGWPMESVEVESRYEKVHRRDAEMCDDGTPGGMIDLITRHITLTGDLTEEQRSRIAVIATRCPVVRTLQNGPQIVDEVVVGG